MDVIAVPVRNPHRRRWSRAARDLVRANLDAKGKHLSALVSKLEEESGNPRWACRRFAGAMGIRSKRSQRSWTVQEQQRLLKLLDLRPGERDRQADAALVKLCLAHDLPPRGQCQNGQRQLHQVHSRAGPACSPGKDRGVDCTGLAEGTGDPGRGIQSRGN